MNDIIIKKTADDTQRIVLQTDSEQTDYQSRFTVMTISGKIDGLELPFRVGSVTSLYEISQFLADNTDAGIDGVFISNGNTAQTITPATPKILEAELHAIVDESSYKNYTGDGYAKEYPYEESKQYLPWLRFSVKKSVKATPFDIEISHNGEACTFGGNASDFGTVSGTKMTLKDYDSLMFACKKDLGVTNSKGTWTMKFTMNNVSITREVTIQ